MTKVKERERKYSALYYIVNHMQVQPLGDFLACFCILLLLLLMLYLVVCQATKLKLK